MVEKIRFNKIHLVILLILLVTSAIIYSYNIKDYGLLNPDESIILKYSLLYKESGVLYEKNVFNVNTGLDIYRGRGEIIINGITYSRKFIGFPFLVGINSILFNKSLILYFTVFMALLGFLYLFFICNELEYKSILPPIFLLFFPVYWYWANFSLFENITASVFFIMGYYYLLKSLNKKDILANPILMTFFFSISWFIRMDYLIFFIPLLLIYSKEFFKKYSIKNLIFFGFIFLITIFPMFYFSYNFYGYLGAGDNSTEIGKNFITNLRGGFFIFKENVKSIIFSIPVYNLFILFGMILVFFNENNKIRKKYALFLLLSFITFSLFFLTGVPLKKLSYLHESYTRYFLPIYILSLPLIYSFLEKISTKKIKISLILLLFILPIPYTAELINQNYKAKASYSSFAEDIFNVSEQNAIIYTYGLDKTLIPHRTIGLIDDGIFIDNKFSSALKTIKVPQYIYLGSTNITRGDMLGYLQRNNISFTPVEDFKKGELLLVSPF